MAKYTPVSYTHLDVYKRQGMSVSLAAYIKGFLEYKKDSHIKGVIFNQMSPMLYPRMKKLVEEELGIKVLGYVPRVEDSMNTTVITSGPRCRRFCMNFTTGCSRALISSFLFHDLPVPSNAALHHLHNQAQVLAWKQKLTPTDSSNG